MKKLISFLLLASVAIGCSKPDSNDHEGSGNGATGAKITFEDVQAFSNGTPVDLPTGVGFYSKSGYHLATTTSALVYTDAAYPGVHFHTSSSYVSPLPGTIRMKVQVEFY